MDFARKQLEKYGWTDGKGLGKHENGMSEALKPKLKRSAAGVGHDPAAEFNEHWWTTLYDKAAANVEVKEKNGKTKKIKTKDETEFVITNSTWKLNKKVKDNDNKEQYADYFVRTAVLTNGASNVERVREVESEEEEEKKDVFKMTDEELFAKCEGRTAHKLVSAFISKKFKYPPKYPQVPPKYPNLKNLPIKHQPSVIVKID